MRGCWGACAPSKDAALGMWWQLAVACWPQGSRDGTWGAGGHEQHTGRQASTGAALLCRCKEDVASAETDLQDILKDLRRQLRLPSLEYKTVQNQGEYLIEVPTERTDVPKVCCKAGT